MRWNFSKFTTQHKTIILFGLWTYWIFIQKCEWICQQQEKSWEKNYTFFIKPLCLLIRETRRKQQIFEVDFDYLR